MPPNPHGTSETDKLMEINGVQIDLKKEIAAIEELLNHRKMQKIMAQESLLEDPHSKFDVKLQRYIWTEILETRNEVLRYDLSHRSNLIRVVDNLIGMCKCFAGL